MKPTGQKVGFVRMIKKHHRLGAPWQPALNYHADKMERVTKQRLAIRQIIKDSLRPLLAQEILEQARPIVPALSLGTVYRNLKVMVEEGEIKPVFLPGENPRYENAEHHHHHHFQCLRCRRVFDIHACPGELSELAPKGFVVEDHELTLYGRCLDCKQTTSGDHALAINQDEALKP
jgi:Fur family ferric uptake transcriptional regulator